jgi:hypothetical protein
VAQAQGGKKLPRHIDHLCVQGRIAVAQSLNAKLLMLSVPPLLRPLVPEYGGKVIKPHRLGQVMHAMLNICTTNRGCALRTQGHRVAAAILEGIGLLLHNVGGRADGANKKAGILENRGVNTPIAIKLAQRRCLLLNVSPIALLLRQNV